MEEIKHSPLSERDGLLSSDVADAIEFLIQRDVSETSPLPKAYSLSDVVDMLIQIAHTDDEGIVLKITTAARGAFGEKYFNRLQNSSVFQAGYKRYEKRTKHPVVPTTEFFFKNEFCGDRDGDGVGKTLDVMSDLEIRQSLPKRPKMTPSDLNDENSELIPSGAIAGVVIFPQNSEASLLRAWLERRAAGTEGSIRSTVAALEHASPDAASIDKLKARSKVTVTAMTRALPKPKGV